MNLLHMKHAIEVAKAGSLSKAAEVLLIAAPNISRSIKELENDLGIAIFDRTQSGMKLTPEGEEFIGFAKEILGQIDRLESYYKEGEPKKQVFSVSVPRAAYIAEAFAGFSKTLSKDAAEIVYKETNAQRTVQNLLSNKYRLGIIRYAEGYDQVIKTLLEQKGLQYELVAEFDCRLLLSKHSPLAAKESLEMQDLADFIEVAHADPHLPAQPQVKAVQEEQPDTTARRIFAFERASQLELLGTNPETFMWAAPLPTGLLQRYGLVQKSCGPANRHYKDLLVYKEGYKLSELDKRFITILCETKRKYL